MRYAGRILRRMKTFLLWLGCVALAVAQDLPKLDLPGVREQHVMIPMRDGVQLATDIYRLAAAQGPLPVLLERTPYGVVAFWATVAVIEQRGPQIFVQQIVTSTWEPFFNFVGGKHESYIDRMVEQTIKRRPFWCFEHAFFD